MLKVVDVDSTAPATVFLKYNTKLKKGLRNHALDEYNARRDLPLSSGPVVKVPSNKLLTKPISTTTTTDVPATDVQPLECWLFHSTNVDSKERCHLWNFNDGLITLYLSKSKTLFYKQIPLSSIKEAKLLKNGTKLRLKLDNRIVMLVTSKLKSRSSNILKPWFVKLTETLETGKDHQDSIVRDEPPKQKNGVFYNTQFAIDFGNATSESKVDLRNLITKNGGQISYIFTKNTKYLVCCAQRDFYKSQRAAKMGIEIVSKQFLEQCITEGKLIQAARSDENLKTAQDQFSKGKICLHHEEKVDDGTKEFRIDTLKRYKVDDADCPDFPDEYYVVKFAFFLNEEKKSVACLEAHVATESPDHTENPYRVMISLQSSAEKIVRFFHIVDDSYKLCKCYEAVAKSYENDGTWKRQVDVMNLNDLNFIASEKLKNLLEEMKISKGSLHCDVERLVASIWNDSLGELAKRDIAPENLTIHDVCNGMIALLKIEQAIKNNSDCHGLSKEFYRHIHLKNDRVIDSMQAVAKEREICQVLKDVVCMKENLWNAENIPPSILQYSALNCVIQHIDPTSAEFKSVLDLMPAKNEIKYDVINVYRINRSVEDVEFSVDIKNRKLLFHSTSSSNIVSILSRGLIMPSKASDELGIPRTDEGYLGHGVYFTDSFAMSSKYTSVSASRGLRLMLVHEVALGDVYETNERMPHLKTPPARFNSVKGNNLHEKLNGDEFVVYSINQQKMRYLIEFTLDHETVYTDPNLSPLSIFKAPMKSGVVESPKFSQPALKEVEFGLVSSAKNSVKLEEFHVRGKIVDLVAEVTIFQVYRNNFNSKIEGKYVFPLEENVAVCGFEAYINEKHVVGVVKEKEQARKEYKKAVAEGHGAYLMEEEEPSVFSLSLGNIPAHAKVVIKIKYVCELETISDPDSFVHFTLPKNLSNWKQDSTLIGASPTQGNTESSKVAVDTKKTSFMLSVDMPHDILEIKSPTHNISWKKTAAKACVKLTKSSSLLEKNLRLFIRVAEIHVPRIWVEQNDSSSSEVAMVTFFPEFDFEACNDYQCTILLDMSCSMTGELSSYAKYISKAVINALPEKSKFNVITFGSFYKEVFVTHEQASDKMKDKALEIVGTSQANLGGSDLIHILGSQYLLLRGAEKHCLHNIFLISDGHVTNEDRVLRLASKISSVSSSQTRFFTFAVGDTPNCHFLRKICAVSGGQFEHFLPTIKHAWDGQVENQMRCAKQPVLTDVHIEWCNYEAEKDDTSIFTNVPNKPKCLFSGSRITAYSFLPNCSKATLHARILGVEISTVVTVNFLSKITGKTLHYLASKAVFKEYDTANLADDALVNQIYHDQQKSFITSLSIKHSVVCKFTSFIAVEKRDDKEDMSIASGPTMEELLKSAFIDDIPEVPWEGIELSVKDKIDELLKLSRQNESSSILQARNYAEDAAKLCEKLPDDQLKKLLVSAAYFRLGIQCPESNPRQVLDCLLLQRGSLNFETINEISRCEDRSYSNALEELTSLSWPAEDYVRLMSIPSSCRLIFISGFHYLFENEPSFYEEDIQTSFWDCIHDIDMKQDAGSLFGLVASRLKEVRVRNRVRDILSRQTLDTHEERGILRRGHRCSRVRAPLAHNMMYRDLLSAPTERGKRAGRICLIKKLESPKPIADADTISNSNKLHSGFATPTQKANDDDIAGEVEEICGLSNELLIIPTSLVLESSALSSADSELNSSPVNHMLRSAARTQVEGRSNSLRYARRGSNRAMAIPPIIKNENESMPFQWHQAPGSSEPSFSKPARFRKSYACFQSRAPPVDADFKSVSFDGVEEELKAQRLQAFSSSPLPQSIPRMESEMPVRKTKLRARCNRYSAPLVTDNTANSFDDDDTKLKAQRPQAPSYSPLSLHTESKMLVRSRMAHRCSASSVADNTSISFGDDDVELETQRQQCVERIKSLKKCVKRSSLRHHDVIEDDSEMFDVASKPSLFSTTTVDKNPTTIVQSDEVSSSLHNSLSRHQFDNALQGSEKRTIKGGSGLFGSVVPRYLRENGEGSDSLDSSSSRSSSGSLSFGPVTPTEIRSYDMLTEIPCQHFAEHYIDEVSYLCADNSPAVELYEVFHDVGGARLTPVALLASELQRNGFDASKFQHIADPTQPRSFTPDDPRLQQFSYCSTEQLIMTTIEQVVTEAGGRSLGLQCFNACLQLVFLNVMLILCDHISKESYHDEMKTVLEALMSLVKSSDDKNPLLFSRLELGTSWNDAAGSVIDLVCKKLPRSQSVTVD